jgi:hypothetical protein
MIKLLLTMRLCGFSAASSAASHDDFARLFSRASERSAPDKLRQNQKLKPEAVQLAPATITLASPESVRLYGYVKRGDGKKSTLWINNQAVQEDSTLGNVHVGRLKQQGSRLGSN